MSNNGRIDLPDLNEGLDSEEMLIDDLAIIPFQGPPTVTELEVAVFLFFPKLLLIYCENK